MKPNPHLPPLAPPVVGPDRQFPNFTVKAVVLSALLSVVLAAANAYLGLLVGMTVSASIPAAAISMGVFRLFRRSDILENNAVQTAASSGEALAAGLIFTIPALVILGAWPEYRYWPIFFLGTVGGVMGVIFTIPLRRALIVEARLTFPEGVATAEVLKTGGIEYDADHPEKNTRSPEAARGLRLLLTATGLGGAYKLLESLAGVFSSTWATTQAWLGGRYLFTGDITLSPALLGVGLIIGLNSSLMIGLGGALGTLLGVPLNWIFHRPELLAASGLDPATPAAALSPEQWAELADQSWRECRRIGVGMMLVGGFWSLLTLARPMGRGLQASWVAYRAAVSGHPGSVPRTERDLPAPLLGWILLATLVPTYWIYHQALAAYEGQVALALFMTFLTAVFGFIFSCVAGYIAGLIGSSNSPISGVTVATVVVASVILVGWMGHDGLAATLGPIAVLYLAGVVCSAASMAGDNTQDLKCGHVVGATPWTQQIYQFIGVGTAAVAIPLVLVILDRGHGIGRPIIEGGTFLPAPQATLMRDIATSIFSGTLAWSYILLGCVLAALVIALDRWQEKRGSTLRFPVLAVAVGVYLPLGLSVPILLGGILSHSLARHDRTRDEASRLLRENTTVLLASGLITGEALVGVTLALAVVATGFTPADPRGWAGAAGCAALIGMAVFAYRQSRRA